MISPPQTPPGKLTVLPRRTSCFRGGEEKEKGKRMKRGGEMGKGGPHLVWKQIDAYGCRR